MQRKRNNNAIGQEHICNKSGTFYRHICNRKGTMMQQKRNFYISIATKAELFKVKTQ